MNGRDGSGEVSCDGGSNSRETLRTGMCRVAERERERTMNRAGSDAAMAAAIGGWSGIRSLEQS